MNRVDRRNRGARILVVLIAGSVAWGLAGCGGRQEAEKAPSTSTVPAADGVPGSGNGNASGSAGRTSSVTDPAEVASIEAALDGADRVVASADALASEDG